MSDDFIDEGWEFVEDESDGEASIEYVGFDESDTATPETREPPTSPATPDTTPSDNYARGTVVFDGTDLNLIQKMEIRGNNGVTEVPRDVETKYLVVGPTHTSPTDLIQLDNPSFYSQVTETSIRYDVSAIAKHVDQLHENGPEPKFIAAIHTHPSGQTTPSTVDRTSPQALKRELDRYFSNFEFFQGIHGLQGRNIPDSTSLRELQQGEGHIWWYGEHRRHEVAFYDSEFQPTVEVIVK